MHGLHDSIWRTGEANRVKGIQNDPTDANMSIMHHHVTTIQSQNKITWNWITTHLPYFSRKLSGEGLQAKHNYCHLSPLNGGCTPPSSNSPWILPATSASKVHDMARRTAARNSCEKWSKVGDLGKHVPNLIPTAWHGDWRRTCFYSWLRAIGDDEETIMSLPQETHQNKSMLTLCGIVISVPRTQSWSKPTIPHLEPPKSLNPEE